MASVIMFRMVKVTNDQSHTEQELRNEVYNIASDLNLQPSMAKVVLNSFTHGGLVDTYNDLGTMDNWRCMITDMLETAFTER